MPEKRSAGGVRLPTMNRRKDPVEWPTASPAVLSEDARALYGAGRQRELDRDWFAPRAGSRYVSPEEKSAYEPGARDLAAVAEIEAAGLGRLRGRTLYCTPVHERYTVAYGRGTQLVKVYLIDSAYMEETLLAVLVGADFESRDQRRDGLVELSVATRHEDGTDVEEDASRTALIEVLNPGPPVFQGYGRVQMSGLLRKAQLWPIGTDPALMGDEGRGTTALIEPEMCMDCEKAHPYVPYLPPEDSDEGLKGSLVKLVAVPVRSYAVSTDGPGSPTRPEGWREKKAEEG